MSAARPRAAVVVAHPDDEILWCGGFVLTHASWQWHVAALCRASDPDRAPRFHRVVRELGATGAIGDLDDGPDQTPLDDRDVAEAILDLLPAGPLDLVLTHGPAGEYTRHRRHEECCRSVVGLWAAGRLEASAVWLFAFHDGGRRFLPRVDEGADRRHRLTESVWREKHRIMTELYGFAPESWEARTTPREEGFLCFENAADASRAIEGVQVPP